MNRLSVRYHSPAQGLLEFDWQGELLQNGGPVSLGPYPRYDNPYAQAEFLSETIYIRLGEHRLHLNWPAAERRVD